MSASRGRRRGYRDAARRGFNKPGPPKIKRAPLASFFAPSILRECSVFFRPPDLRAQTLKLSPSPAGRTAVDAPLLTTPWQQRANDALLLLPLLLDC